MSEFRRLVRIARKRGYATKVPSFKNRVSAPAAPFVDDRQLALL